MTTGTEKVTPDEEKTSQVYKLWWVRGFQSPTGQREPPPVHTVPAKRGVNADRWSRPPLDVRGTVR